MSKQYLAYIRELNKAKTSVCHYCKSQSTGINSVGYRIIFVCNTHYIPDNPNVIHRVYPQGMEYPKEMMDPNIGGYLSNKPKE
jgi:hypothetical protein